MPVVTSWNVTFIKIFLMVAHTHTHTITQVYTFKIYTASIGEHFKNIIEKIKEDLNMWCDISCSCIKEVNTVKMSHIH